MDFLTGFDPSTWVNAGALILLSAVMIGGWRIAKPAVDAWLKQYQALLDYTLEMTRILATINVNLEQLNSKHTKLSNHLNDHEKDSERRHGEVLRDLRGLAGSLGRQK